MDGVWFTQGTSLLAVSGGFQVPFRHHVSTRPSVLPGVLFPLLLGRPSSPSSPAPPRPHFSVVSLNGPGILPHSVLWVPKGCAPFGLVTWHRGSWLPVLLPDDPVSLLEGWDTIPVFSECPAVGTGPGRQQEWGWCVWWGHCACPHRYKWNSLNFFLANFLLPAIFWTSDQVYLFLSWLKKQTKQKPGLKFRQLETQSPQGRERLAHFARNSECQKAKGYYRKNSNLPRAISLWWLVYNKQNRLNLLICQCWES